MKILVVLLSLIPFLFSGIPAMIDDVDGNPVLNRPNGLLRDRMVIDRVGDIRAILSGQGTSIIVSQNAEAIAVIYGAPTSDPWNPMEIKVAYSEDSGVTWTKYGPFSGACRRAYHSVDGMPDFHLNVGHLYF
ncbi:MAG: hypothetical protein WBE28_01725, partial [bacterium]